MSEDDNDHVDKRKWMTEEQAAACKRKYDEWGGSLRGHAEDLAQLSKQLGLSEVQVEKRFHYIRKLEKRQKNSKRGNVEADPEAVKAPTFKLHSGDSQSDMSERKQKQARLTKEQADAIQVKYREWSGSLKNRSRQVGSLASHLGLTVAQIDKRFRYLRKKTRASLRKKTNSLRSKASRSRSSDDDDEEDEDDDEEDEQEVTLVDGTDKVPDGPGPATLGLLGANGPPMQGDGNHSGSGMFRGSEHLPDKSLTVANTLMVSGPGDHMESYSSFSAGSQMNKGNNETRQGGLGLPAPPSSLDPSASSTSSSSWPVPYSQHGGSGGGAGAAPGAGPTASSLQLLSSPPFQSPGSQPLLSSSSQQQHPGLGSGSTRAKSDTSSSTHHSSNSSSLPQAAGASQAHQFQVMQPPPQSQPLPLLDPFWSLPHRGGGVASGSGGAGGGGAVASVAGGSSQDGFPLYAGPIQEAVIQKLHGMVREEADTDRIEQMLIYLAGRFTFNSEAVYARLATSHLSKLQSGRLCESGIPPHLLFDNVRMKGMMGLLDVLMDADVTWYRASQSYEPLAVFQIEESTTHMGRGFTKLVDLQLSGCSSPLFLVIPKGRQQAVLYMLRSPWVRALLGSTPALSSIRVIMEDALDDIMAEPSILMRFSDNLIAFLQMISKPVSVGG